MVRAKIVVHSTQTKTPTPDVPPELLTQVPPTYMLPIFVAPCEPAMHSSPSQSQEYKGIDHMMGEWVCSHIAMMSHSIADSGEFDFVM